MKLLVLDEADEMFSKGFKEQARCVFLSHGQWFGRQPWQVYGIKRSFPDRLQTILVSATLPEEAFYGWEAF